MNKTYYKKVDRSLLEWGITIPKEYVKYFLGGVPVKLGSHRKIEVVFGKNKYVVRFNYVKRTTQPPVYQIRWDNNKELLSKLRKTFIQSYVILKSQKELFDISKKERKYFRSKLRGGEQEVLIIKPISPKKIKFNVFIRIENEWNTLFERLAEENVFGWLFDKDRKYLISRSTSWLRLKDFEKHANVVNVIYYLANTKKKLVYIGKAEILGRRVRPGRKHQNMPSDWDKFRYDIVKSEYSNILDKIEDHTIRAFASILKNEKNYSSLELSSYKLINSNWKKL